MFLFKQNIFLLIAAILAFTACTKNNDLQPSSQEEIALKGGSGGGGNNTGFLQSVVPGGAANLISGKTDSIFVSFTQPAPAAGWTLTLTSSNAAVTVPATFFVKAGLTSVYVPVSASTVASAVNVTITVKLSAQSKSTTIKLFPLTYSSFPAPQLQSPGNGSKFGLQLLVTFDWNDNNNAYLYDFQVSKDANFSAVLLELYLPTSIYPTNWFDGTGTRYWRVCFLDASQNGGPWSQVNNFEIKPQ
ncbi:MAG: hypothetical protein H0W62_04725 [Chitinophagales bacterium]|nr:hypothetical protein [Chitinophagales bacterium]